MNNKKAAALLAFCACAAFPAQAARPMITDDARIVDPKACQVESWVRRNTDSWEFWAMPACNPTGNVEITFGGARMHDDGTSGSQFTDNVFQLKTILRPLENDNWGLALAVGTDRHLHREAANGWPGDEYFYVPLSVALYGDQWVMHFNAGMTHLRANEEHKNQGTWGFGNEVRLRPDLYFIPEIFGNDRGRPFYQIGFRTWIVQDRVQMDATYGNRLTGGTSEHWISIGMRLLSPPFLP